ncbi:DUF2334 domain-containing protein [Gracilibacillus timonensis]|uniref:DUF2334 domain-containing protein n=1 Tax=Gracilibacillus timonensis TaxID=1816696 RepID=UPI000B1E9C19|nr:DUF2334 domain-containing protein [Gracilibacillus timonensis]
MYKRMMLCCLVLFIGILFISSTQVSAKKEDNVLVIYTIEEDSQIKEVRVLDTLIGQFASDYQLVQDDKLPSLDLHNYSRLIYFGAGKNEISAQAKEIIDQFEGSVFAIGHNLDQFNPRFAWVDITGETLVNQLTFTQEPIGQTLSEDHIVYQLEGEKAQVLLKGNDKVPLIVKNNGDYYFAAQSLFSPFGEALTEAFRAFFDEKKEAHIRYLRLEDIHPMIDADLLREQAEYLQAKDIPYLVAVIPVYTNEAGQTKHLSDSPKLVKTLKYMQDNGASMILHGYKHQYRRSETGEGFEFWDVENDRPIYQKATEEPKFRDDFTSEEAYQSFIAQGEAYERRYIEDAINRGVEELTAHGLYPLAMEAPHYTMSQQGYEILSEHFTSYVGRLQLTDFTWERDYAPIFESTPAFLHGMTVYPETAGFIEQENKQSFVDMQHKVQELQKYKQAYISAFYHPYLGLEGLKKVVKNLEQASDAAWLDLKKKDNLVQTELITIASKDGEIEVTKPFAASDYEKNIKLKQSLYVIIPGLIFFIVVILLLVSKFRRPRS